MYISTVLAEILGIVFLVMGLELLLKKKFMVAVLNEAVEKPGLLWTMGLLALVIGAVMVAIQNVWSADWRVVITIVGWLAVLKGVVIMFFPHFTMSLYRKWGTEGFLVFGGVVATLLGLFFLYVSFWG